MPEDNSNNDQQQQGVPDWAKQLAQQMNDRQQGAAQQGDQDAQAVAKAQQQQAKPAAPDYGKADPERLVKDARFYASQPDAVWQLIKDTFTEARGGVSESKITEIEKRQTELELRAVRAEAARDFGLTADETTAFLTGNTPEQIIEQAKYLKDYKAKLETETKSQGAQQQAQGATARQATDQQQSANNQTQVSRDAQGNIIIVPGNYPDTRSPIEKAKAALVEKAAKGESFYQ